MMLAGCHPTDMAKFRQQKNSSMTSRPPTMVLANKKAFSQVSKSAALLLYEAVHTAVTSAIGE
jgi:hypothetical protein